MNTEDDRHPQQVEYTTNMAAWKAVEQLRLIESHLRTIKWGIVVAAFFAVLAFLR